MQTFFFFFFLLAASPFLPAQEQAAAAGDNLAAAQDALHRDHPQQAIAILQRLAAQAPPAKGVMHELGIAYYRTGKLAEAKSAFAKAIEQDASDRESVQMEGLTLYRLGQPGAAIPYLERVVDWMPNANADAQYVLGLCYLNAQRYDDARIAFAKEFGQPPSSAAAYLLLATMLRHAHLPDMAAIQVQKALALSPDLPMAHLTLGEIALYKSNIDLAVRELEAERSINPNYSPVYDRLGEAYLRLGKLPEAQQALTKAIALDTTLTSAFIEMGNLLLRNQDPQTAIMYLRHAEKMDPGDFTTHSLLAQAYHRTGQEDEARQESALAIRARGEAGRP